MEYRSLLSLRDRWEKEPPAELKNKLVHINNSLDHHEKLHKIIVMKGQWLIENNLLTPSLKIKRNEIEKRYVTYYTNRYNLMDSVVMATS